MVTEKSFPLIDLELFWDDSERLEYQVHQKKNQLLKYLNKERTHTKVTFRATPNGFLNRLAKLISILEENSNMGNNERYLIHTISLAKKGLSMNIFQP